MHSGINHSFELKTILLKKYTESDYYVKSRLLSKSVFMYDKGVKRAPIL